jgi:hypothetical protein
MDIAPQIVDKIFYTDAMTWATFTNHVATWLYLR